MSRLSKVGPSDWANLSLEVFPASDETVAKRHATIRRYGRKGAKSIESAPRQRQRGAFEV